MFAKACGLSSEKHIDWAIEAGYSAIGVVLHPRSPRYCDADKAKALAEYARGKITTVAVAKKRADIRGLENVFDYVQLYEPADIGNLIYAGTGLPMDCFYRFFVYDASIGSGVYHEPPPWVKDHRETMIISGGLTSENVGRVIRDYRPFGVDVSSGIESSPGVKDKARMFEFIHEVNNETR